MFQEYRHLIQLHCPKCQTTSEVQSSTKVYKCQSGKCRAVLKFQCKSCCRLYKHYSSAYSHRKYNCKIMNGFVKNEVKIEPLLDTSKKYNPYNRKVKKPKVEIDVKPDIKVCAKCNKTYCNYYSMKAHEKFCGVKSFIKCDFCSFKSKYQVNVNRHIANIHIKSEGNPSIECQRLKKLYRNEKRHSYKSKNIKKFKQLKRVKFNEIYDCVYCAHCNHQSKRKSNLATHIQRRHSDLFPNNMFLCKLCNKYCGDSYSLATHLNKKCTRNLKLRLLDVTMNR